jgi:hypothetical protein
VGNCISGQNECLPHVRIHATHELDPPAVSTPQPNPTEPIVGPPARSSVVARPASLDSLPDGPRLAIAAFLQSRRDVHGQAQDLHGMVQDVSALALVNRAFRTAITEQPSGSDVLSKFRLLDRLKQAVKLCLSQRGERGVHDAFLDNLTAPMLGLLSPAARAELVQQAIDINSLELRGMAIARLAPGLADLLPLNRAALVEAAITMASESHYGAAVAAGGLLKHMNALQPQQREALIATMGSLIEVEGVSARRSVIDQLGGAIRHLPAQQRESLVQWALSVPLELDRAGVLGGLGLAMAAEPSMNAGGRMVEAALLVVNDDSRAYAIGRLAVGMGSMEPQLRGRFETAAFGFTDETLKTDVAFKLGAVAEHLSDTARADLVRFATRPGAIALSAAYAAEGAEVFMSCRACGLAAGMAHLSREQCDDLANAALGYGDHECRAEAIGAMGQGLEHLRNELRERLVAAAIALGSEHPESMMTAIAGLGVGANHLNDNQRNRLLETVVETVIEITDKGRFIARLRALGALTAGVAAMDAA